MEPNQNLPSEEPLPSVMTVTTIVDLWNALWCMDFESHIEHFAMDTDFNRGRAYQARADVIYIRTALKRWKETRGKDGIEPESPK